MSDINFVDFLAAQGARNAAGDPGSKDRNKKVRLILLACHMLAARLGLRGQSTALRITVEALANSYHEDGESQTLDSAKKMAERDIDVIRQVFGIAGDDVTGYQLGMDFAPPKAYLQMLEYWLDWLNHHHHSRDTVLKVMLEGLVTAINSAFTNDPICIPRLASALAKKYAKTNMRDASRPLKQIFDDRAMAHFLPLETVSEQDDSYKVDTRLEPLLMRKKKGIETGYETDDTIVLSRAGLIRSEAHRIIDTQAPALSTKLHRISRAVEQMECWQSTCGRPCVPYALHYQQASGEFELVMYWHDHGGYEELAVSSIGSLPDEGDADYYCPAGMDKELWSRWKSLSFWRV